MVSDTRQRDRDTKLQVLHTRSFDDPQFSGNIEGSQIDVIYHSYITNFTLLLICFVVCNVLGHVLPFL